MKSFIECFIIWQNPLETNYILPQQNCSTSSRRWFLYPITVSMYEVSTDESSCDFITLNAWLYIQSTGKLSSLLKTRVTYWNKSLCHQFTVYTKESLKYMCIATLILNLCFLTRVSWAYMNKVILKIQKRIHQDIKLNARLLNARFLPCSWCLPHRQVHISGQTQLLWISFSRM